MRIVYITESGDRGYAFDSTEPGALRQLAGCIDTDVKAGLLSHTEGIDAIEWLAEIAEQADEYEALMGAVSWRHDRNLEALKGK